MAPPLIQSYSEKLQKFGNVNFIYEENGPSHYESERTLLVDMGSWNLVHSHNKESIRKESNFWDINKLELRFDFGTIILPSRNESLHWKGHFPMLMPLGNTPLPDIQMENIKNSQEMLNELFQNLGIVTRDSEYFTKFVNCKCPVICALSCPGVTLEDQRAYVILMTTFLILDDIFDQPVDFWKDQIPISMITKAVSIFSSIVMGEKTVGDIYEQDGLGFPHFLPICHLMGILRKEILHLKKNAQENDCFFQSFVQYMEAAAWESSGWSSFNLIEVEDKRNSYVEMRKLTIGLRPCLNIISMLKNVTLSTEIRRDPLFKLLTNKLSFHVTLLNDLFSLKKDIRNREMLNIILIQNLKHPAKYCLDKTLKEIKDCIQEIYNIQERLSIKFPDSKDLFDFFEIGNNWLDAHVRWMFFSSRYIDNEFELNVIL